jgi:hypothetical protein
LETDLTILSGSLGRRQFVKAIGNLGVLAATAKRNLRADSISSSMPWPKLVGSPVLDSLRPVIEHSRDVHTHAGKLREVAGWMAYEDLPMPDYALPLGVGEGKPDETIDFILTADAIDTPSPTSPPMKSFRSIMPDGTGRIPMRSLPA